MVTRTWPGSSWKRKLPSMRSTTMARGPGGEAGSLMGEVDVYRGSAEWKEKVLVLLLANLMDFGTFLVCVGNVLTE